tara:strand:+ start:32 stop:394 length:363 start_codon:yes stop_codon:yes gene_type:complete
MTWKDIISKKKKHTAGRSNPDDFREYGQVTPMGHPKGHKPKKKIAPKKPLSDKEKLRRTKMRMATRKKNKEKKAAEAARGGVKPLHARDNRSVKTITEEEDAKDRKRLKDGPKDIFPKGD